MDKILAYHFPNISVLILYHWYILMYMSTHVQF